MHTPLIKSFIPFALKSNWTDNPKTKFSPTDADVTFGPGKDAYLLNRTEARLNKKREDVMGILQKGQPA